MSDCRLEASTCPSRKPETCNRQPPQWAVARLHRRPAVPGRKSLLVALLLGVALLALPTPEGLSLEGQRATAIFVPCLVLWVSGALPLAVTSLLALALLPLLGVMESQRAFSLFGNEAVFFILGAFILAGALLRSGLSARLALGMLSRFQRGPRTLLLGVMASAAGLSCIMPEHAVAALLFPVVLEIARSMELAPGRSRYGKALFLALAWGAIIGGVGTFLGGARNILAVELLREFNGTTIGFFEWIRAIFPLVALLLAAAYLLLIRAFREEGVDIGPARQALGEKVKAAGPMSDREKRAALVLALTVAAWILGGHRVGLANIALLSAVSLFALNVVTWRDVESCVNWGVILMYGGAITLGVALSQTGATQWAVAGALGEGNRSPWLLAALLVVVSILLTEGMSNAAVVALLLPLGLSLSAQYGLDPKLAVYCVAVPAGLAFNFPMGTPPNAICYASGYYEVKDVLRVGLVLNLAAVVLFLLMARTYWRWIGLEI